MIERLQNSYDYLSAAQRAVNELFNQRLDTNGDDEDTLDPELCVETAQKNLAALQVMLYGIEKRLQRLAQEAKEPKA